MKLSKLGILGLISLLSYTIMVVFSSLAIFLVGCAAIFIYIQLTSVLRSFGDPVFQMKGMILGTAFNAVADPLFIRWFGISGAAIATVLSQLLCLVFALIYEKKKVYFRFDMKTLRWPVVNDILKTVIPSSIQNCTPAVSSMIMVILVNRYDVTTISAYGVVKNIENILFYHMKRLYLQLYNLKKQEIVMKSWYIISRSQRIMLKIR